MDGNLLRGAANSERRGETQAVGVRLQQADLVMPTRPNSASSNDGSAGGLAEGVKGLSGD